jgi:hypothetical protein
MKKMFPNIIDNIDTYKSLNVVRLEEELRLINKSLFCIFYQDHFGLEKIIKQWFLIVEDKNYQNIPLLKKILEQVLLSSNGLKLKDYSNKLFKLLSKYEKNALKAYDLCKGEINDSR